MRKVEASVWVAVAVAVSTVLLSMVLNAWAFTAQTGHWMGYALGVLVPLWVLALTYMGHRARQIDYRLSVASYSLAGFALVVSLPHIAHGYEWLGMEWWEAWSLAVVTDLTQVASKMLVIGLMHQPTEVATAQRQPKAQGARKRASRKQAQAIAQEVA